MQLPKPFVASTATLDFVLECDAAMLGAGGREHPPKAGVEGVVCEQMSGTCSPAGDEAHKACVSQTSGSLS